MYSFLLCVSLGVGLLGYSVCMFSFSSYCCLKFLKGIQNTDKISVWAPRETSVSQLREEAEEVAVQWHLSNGLSMGLSPSDPPRTP